MHIAYFNMVPCPWTVKDFLSPKTANLSDDCGGSPFELGVLFEYHPKDVWWKFIVYRRTLCSARHGFLSASVLVGCNNLSHFDVHCDVHCHGCCPGQERSFFKESMVHLCPAAAASLVQPRQCSIGAGYIFS
jgi:hypothetical protein